MIYARSVLILAEWDFRTSHVVRKYVKIDGLWLKSILFFIFIFCLIINVTTIAIVISIIVGKVACCGTA